MKKLYITIILGSIFLLALACFAEATVLANIKIEATFMNYSSGNTYEADFHLKIIDKANDGFDNNDFVLQKLPSGGGYAVLYSNTTDGFSLSIDAYNASSSRKINLVYSIVPTDTGVVNLTWHISGKKIKLKFKDYGNDGTYTNALSTLDMNAVDYFGAEQTFSEGMRFFGLEGDSNLIPIFFAPPTQASGYSVIGNSYELRINMTNATDMAQFDFNWNGTNYTIYEGNLVFMANFNNDSSLGEDDLHPKDFSWYENNLTSVGATWTSSGKFGGAYSFDGSNDYINMTDFNASQTYGTISAWVNPKKLAVQNLFGTICPDLPSNSGIFALQIRQNTNYYFGLASRTQNVDNLALLAGSTQVSANNWYHVTLVSNGTYYFLYVDGNLESLTVLPGGSSGNNGNWYGNVCTDSNKTVVGGTLYDGTMDAFFNGTIDEVRIWNRSLSANEVKQIYYSNLQKYDTDKWSFYTNEQSLGSGIYAYRGHALDYYDGLNSTELRNVTIENKIVAISLPNSAVDFGDLTLGEQKANLSGMRVQNDGNVYLDIEINATRLFSSNSISYPGANYLFRVGDAGKGNESNGTYSPSSALSWTQFNSVPQFAIYSLNYSSTRNLAALQINITVPLDEAAGKKESTLVITANEA